MGVLIHQPEETLDKVMSEMVRASSRYVFCGEYYDTETVEVPYRGHDGALFRRDYGGLFLELFPSESDARSARATSAPKTAGTASPGGCSSVRRALDGRRCRTSASPAS